MIDRTKLTAALEAERIVHAERTANSRAAFEAAAGFAGSFAGAWVVTVISPDFLRKVLPFILLAITFAAIVGSSVPLMIVLMIVACGSAMRMAFFMVITEAVAV